MRRPWTPWSSSSKDEEEPRPSSRGWKDPNKRDSDSFTDNYSNNSSIMSKLKSFILPSNISIPKIQHENEDGTRTRGRSSLTGVIPDLDIIIKTVNNLSRLHEALAFLNDDKRSNYVKKFALMARNKHGITSLVWAVRRNADFELVKKMVEIGGKDLVLISNNSDENVLHQAAFLGAPYEVFELIVQAGGKDILMQQDRMGNIPLHYACAWGVDENVIKLLADVGGKDALLTENEKKQVPHSDMKKMQRYLCHIGGSEYAEQIVGQKKFEMSFFSLVMLNKTSEAELLLEDKQRRKEVFNKNENGLTVLMVTIWFLGNTSAMFQNRLISLIRKMVKVGGEELVEMKNSTNGNAIHYAAFNNAPLEIIHLLVETAGVDALAVQNNWGSTPCHDACYRQSPVQVIEYLVRHGIAAMTTTNNNGQTPLEILYDADMPSDDHILALQRAWYDLDPHFSSVCSRLVINQTLTWSNRVDPKFITSNAFVKSILNERFIWIRYQMFLFLDFYSQLFIVFFSSAIWLGNVYEGPLPLENLDENKIQITIAVAGLSMCAAWFLLRESVQVYSSSIKHYSRGVGNYFDLFQIIFLFLTIRQLANIGNGGDGLGDASYRRMVFLFSSFLGWTQLLRVVSRLFYKVSVFVYATTQITLQLAPFIVTAAMLVLAFSQAFFIASTGTETCMSFLNDGDVTDDDTTWQCKATSSMFQSFGMLLTTDFEFLTWSSDESDDILLLQIISFLFALVVGILLLNILIAVVNNVFTKVSNESDDAFWTTRMDFMVEVNLIVNTVFTSFRMADKENVDNHDHIVDKVSVRKSFAEYDDKWMKNCCSETDLQEFYKWWYYSWRLEVPKLKTRLWYYYNQASFLEIVYPSKVFQNILFGLKYDEEVKGFTFFIALILSFCHFILAIVVACIVFALGLVSCGTLWPTEMKKFFFFGPLEEQENAGNGTRTEMRKVSGGIEKSRIDMLEQQMVYLKQQNAAMSNQITSIADALGVKSA